MIHGQASNWGGKKASPTYTTWRGLIQRCKNPRHKWYHTYQDKFYEPWADFNVFFADMGERPEGMTLDRINNDLGYGPENCRWVSPTTQLRNKGSTKLSLEIAKEIRKLHSEKKTSKEIQIKLNLTKSLVNNVLYRGDWKEVNE